MTASADELVRTTAAARSIGVARRTLQQWTHDGLLKPTAWTPGGHALWDADDLRRQLDEFHKAWT